MAEFIINQLDKTFPFFLSFFVAEHPAGSIYNFIRHVTNIKQRTRPTIKITSVKDPNYYRNILVNRISFIL